MAIKGKFITYETKSEFLGASNGIGNSATNQPVTQESNGFWGNVPKYSIVLIKETGEIWHNGTYFGNNPTDWSEITNNPLTSTVIGSTTRPIYWDGSKFVQTNELGSFAWKSSLAFSELSSHPTTLSGYGITDAILLTDANSWTKTISPTSITFDGDSWVKIDSALNSLTAGIYLIVIEDTTITYSGTFTLLTGNITTQEEVLLHACGTRATYEGSTVPGILYAKVGYDRTGSATSGTAQLFLAYNHSITNSKLTIKLKKLATL